MSITKRLKGDLEPLLTSKMELFVTIFDSFHSLIFFIKISILDVAGIFDPTLITDIFVSRSWILMDLKSVFLLHRNQLINSNDKKDGWLYGMRVY